LHEKHQEPAASSTGSMSTAGMCNMSLQDWHKCQGWGAGRVLPACWRCCTLLGCTQHTMCVHFKPGTEPAMRRRASQTAFAELLPPS
jgi:hypothetical protein